MPLLPRPLAGTSCPLVSAVQVLLHEVGCVPLVRSYTVGSSRECFTPVTFLYAPHLHIHHVEVLCFRLFPLFF